jgi:hypothetical protein
MTVIQDCLCGSMGGLLGDIEVCEMLETVLTTCCQMRLSGQFLLVSNSFAALNSDTRDSSTLCRNHYACPRPDRVFTTPFTRSYCRREKT